MLATLLAYSDPALDHANGSPPAASAAGTPIGRDEWIHRCTARLVELRPDEPAAHLSGIVEEMWRDESQFSPELAAEIEHESWYFSH